MKIRNLLMIIGVFIFCTQGVQAQDTIQKQITGINSAIRSITPASTRFMIRGYGHYGIDVKGDEFTFTSGAFNPLFIWKQGKRFIFESELEFEFEDNDLNIGFEYANGSYIVSRALIVRVGKFLLPFGTFMERLHPAWVNRLRTKPLGFGHDGIAPGSDVGVEIRGGIQAGRSKLNYAVYVVNGPRLKYGLNEPEEAGMLSFENTTDNNRNKAVGGRLGFLPFSNSSLELGVSGYFAKPGNEHTPFEDDSLYADLEYGDVKANLYAFDLSYVKFLSGIKGVIDIKAQYNISNVSDATYVNMEDTSRYTFTNNATAYYAQLSYRPALVNSDFVKNFELVGRYSNMVTPEGSLWHSTQSQWAIGLNYWLSWRSVIKLSYQSTSIETGDDDGGAEHGSAGGNALFLHLGIGL
jgi:hypothetical protein